MAKSDDPGVVWKQQKTTANDGGPQFWFGSWVVISGTTALVGAKNATINGNTSQGAVYVFRKSNGVWTQTQQLLASDGVGGDQFGTSIALLGTTAIITAPMATVDGLMWRGAAYVFTLSGNKWAQKQKLVARHGPAFETFGTSVAFNSTSAFIGAGGASHAGQYIPRVVYVFRFVPSLSGGTWKEKQILESPAPGDETSFFGASMAVSGTAALIGARASNVGGSIGRGAVYAYAESNGLWQLAQMLTANDGAARDNFGVSIGIEGKTAVIGSPGATIDGNVSQGAVYRFEQWRGHWLQMQKFTAKVGAPLTLFGASVSLRKDSALVGAYGANAYRGAAYLFQNHAGDWRQTKILTANDGTNGDVFGYYTALDITTALIGAYTEEVDGNLKQGAAYFYTRPAIDAPS